MPNLASDRTLTYTTKTSPFLNQVRQVLRLKHMSRRTEASYLYYIIDFIRFHGKRHPQELEGLQPQFLDQTVSIEPHDKVPVNLDDRDAGPPRPTDDLHHLFLVSRNIVLPEADPPIGEKLLGYTTILARRCSINDNVHPWAPPSQKVCSWRALQ